MNKTPTALLGAALLAAAGALTALPALAQGGLQATAKTQVRQSDDRITTSVQLETKGKVLAVHKKRRSLTLEQENGERVMLGVGRELGDLSAVKPGDMISVRYTERLTLKLHKGSAGVREKVESLASTDPASAAGGARTVERTRDLYDVVAKDDATHTITLRGVKGNIERKVDDPKRYAQVAVGDQVEVLLSKGLALMLAPQQP